MKVKAVFINKPGEVETHWVDYPHKKENEVLIKVDAAGICGSDIGAFRGTNPLVTYPRIIGHEVTGI
ncbi:alcohol dehydrogenase, partial [Salmonella enterica]|nr:alcohol dehydrogenase [Salmonella enterica]